VSRQVKESARDVLLSLITVEFVFLLLKILSRNPVSRAGRLAESD
jgi:hypothetical protein